MLSGPDYGVLGGVVPSFDTLEGERIHVTDLASPTIQTITKFDGTLRSVPSRMSKSSNVTQQYEALQIEDLVEISEALGPKMKTLIELVEV